MTVKKAELAARVRDLGLRPPPRATKAQLLEILETAATADVVDLAVDDPDVPAGQREHVPASRARTSARCPAGRPLHGELCRDCIVSGLSRCPGG